MKGTKAHAKSEVEGGFNTLKTAFEKWENSIDSKLHEGKSIMKKRYAGLTGSNVGALALVAVGGYLLWANRFKIQKAIESVGIRTPWMKGNVSEALQSGYAKISGAIEHEASSLSNGFSSDNTRDIGSRTAI